MRKIVERLLGPLHLLALAGCLSWVLAAVIAIRHIIDTPQPLESTLPGEARLYLWRRGHIFYKTLGPQDAPALLLLHAPRLGNSAYEMRNVIDALAQHYRVYAPDLLGFGLSDHPAIAYSGDTYVNLCRDFLTEVVGRPATLLASGLSCNYAAHLAQLYPAHCTRLILIAPVELFTHEQAREPWAALLQGPLARSLIYPLLTTRPVLRLGIDHPRPAARGQTLRSEVDYRYAVTHQFGAAHAPLARLAGRLSLDAAQQFEALQQPVLLIWGASSVYDARSLPDGRHLPARAETALVQDAGVAVAEERPEQVVALIDAWSRAGAAGQGEPEAPARADAQACHEGPQENQPFVYCAKCKKKTPMLDAQQVTTKNGRAALRGTCSACGGGQFRSGQRSKELL